MVHIKGYDHELFEPYIRRNSYNAAYWDIVLRPGYIHGLMRGPYKSYAAASKALHEMEESGEIDEYIY